MAMFSARFDSGPVEHKIRRVHQILREDGYNSLMVEVDEGDSFGVLTARYLGQLRRERGMMIAVCTKHYAEKTESKYCSFYELQFALTHGIRVLPLKMEDTYPPEPPWGKNHPDKHGDALGYIDMAFRPDVKYLDCRGKSEVDMASAIAKRLRCLPPGKESKISS